MEQTPDTVTHELHPSCISSQLPVKAGPGFHGGGETGLESASPIWVASYRHETQTHRWVPEPRFCPARDTGSEQGNKTKMSWDTNTVKLVKVARQTDWMRTARTDFLTQQHPRHLRATRRQTSGLPLAGWQYTVTQPHHPREQSCLARGIPQSPPKDGKTTQKVS